MEVAGLSFLSPLPPLASLEEESVVSLALPLSLPPAAFLGAMVVVVVYGVNERARFDVWIGYEVVWKTLLRTYLICPRGCGYSNRG